MFRPGYAIEYDYFPPTQLKYSLETKLLDNLFMAGQVNGTTGYEEAACQGLMAGINAHQKVGNLEPLILKRSEAYIGVLIDDLISKGTEEPYRMFTSRAEFRTLLRQDNADMRLTEMSYLLGLASQERMSLLRTKKESIALLTKELKKVSLQPEDINNYLIINGSSPIDQKQKLIQLLVRPNVNLQGMKSGSVKMGQVLSGFTDEVLEETQIQIKYETYIEKERDLVARMAQLEELQIPSNFNYDRIQALSSEAMQKFKKIRPSTLGQASRISGVNPSDIQILMVFMGR